MFHDSPGDKALNSDHHVCGGWGQGKGKGKGRGGGRWGRRGEGGEIEREAEGRKR